VTAFALDDIRRPLRLSELLAATVRIYSSRGWAFSLIGLLQAGTIVAAEYLNVAATVAVASVAFTVSLALVARLVAGDAFRAALTHAAQVGPVLIVLALIVGVPFAVSTGFGLILLVFSAIWLALTGFAIPATMIEKPPDASFGGRIAYSLRRTTTLARVEFWHAVAVVAALLVIYLLLGIVLAIAIAGAADLRQQWALAVAQIPLAPFFFIGLSVLYFDQRARALETVAKPSPRPEGGP
jgi:hypothetical protein